jgi:hypothetical protein
VQRWTVWSTSIFTIAALATLALFLVERNGGTLVPTWIAGPIVWAAILAMPGAVVGVVKRSNTRSRVLWIVLLTLCIALAGAMLFYVR